MGLGKNSAYKLIRTGKEIKAFLRIPFLIPKIGRIADKPSYYPELKRKSRAKRWMDNFKWILRDKLPNVYYTSYGLDIEQFHDPKDYIPQREFINRRNAGNQKPKMTISGDYNYIVLLRDKYVFANYLKASLGENKVIESKGIIDRGRLYLPAEKAWFDLDRLNEMEGRWVFKVIDGECGVGVFLVSIQDGTYVMSGKTLSLDEFSQSVLQNSRWLIQPIVRQHEALKAFGTESVNTIRAITIKGNSGAIHVFNAFLRVGADAASFVDNRAMGGYGVGIDTDTGKLMRYGFQHDSFGTKAEKHPLSGIVFDGYQLPFWDETVQLIRDAHRQFYEIQSIGWDVVITPDGPVLLEGNDDWEIGGPQDTCGGLKELFGRLIES